ncbi:hypothetical protein CDAR_243281 [Caerostris darwini]|uniref:Uncharacterized protein n=1 Tax=Caerostris darwini TaxID=1538125 RepID=A0AAV4MN84_9ARAC|nr:hypothetical protein CDAR_243281 [Caerostris darwini]
MSDVDTTYRLAERVVRAGMKLRFSLPVLSLSRRSSWTFDILSCPNSERISVGIASWNQSILFTSLHFLTTPRLLLLSRTARLMLLTAEKPDAVWFGSLPNMIHFPTIDIYFSHYV